MSPLSTKDLHRIFEDSDQNGDGLLSLDELNWLLERTGVHLSLEELESSVGKSSLNFDEFLVFCNSIGKQDGDDGEGNEVSEDKVKENDELVEAFNVFDMDSDGFISCMELQCVLSRLGLWDENCGKDPRSMIFKYDTNFDGLVDFQEFKNMMLQNVSSN